MVRFDQLEAMAQSSDDVAQFLHRATELRITRGVTVRPLPIWKFLKHDPDGSLAHFLDRSHFWRALHPELNSHIDDALQQLDFILSTQRSTFADVSDFNLDEPPKSWSDLSKQLYPTRRAAEKIPLLLTAMIHHDRSKEADEELIQLRRIAAQSSLPAIIEPNHDATLQLAAGDSVVVGSKSGVIGGFMHDPTSTEYFGVTCAHVSSKSDRVNDLGGNHIGDCVASVSLVQNANNVPCDPLKSSTPLNKLDIALIKMNTAPVASGRSVATVLKHGEAVNVHRTGASPLGFNIRSLVMSFQTRTSGASGSTIRYCFERLVELYPQTSVTQQGDSGAWGYNQSGDWAGMIIGGDSMSSFAVRAEHAVDWARNDAFSSTRASITLY